ncbi:hypothetical protein K435DRAFT_242626 [Dendrothele bispora CBS 962.96]|uniref:Uncharacterized protein n=1 Tax=Dendrothele bispora (strain CBS 962.96) TaxID=1314807 RepID=A0A4S8LP57_DENBC|nr:hypothetical protein K435DRAFT_242626 [Dendrothele bispora CBS 962.96]
MSVCRHVIRARVRSSVLALFVFPSVRNVYADLFLFLNSIFHNIKSLLLPLSSLKSSMSPRLGPSLKLFTSPLPPAHVLLLSQLRKLCNHTRRPGSLEQPLLKLSQKWKRKRKKRSRFLLCVPDRHEDLLLVPDGLEVGKKMRYCCGCISLLVSISRLSCLLLNFFLSLLIRSVTPHFLPLYFLEQLLLAKPVQCSFYSIFTSLHEYL